MKNLHMPANISSFYTLWRKNKQQCFNLISQHKHSVSLVFCHTLNILKFMTDFVSCVWIVELNMNAFGLPTFSLCIDSFFFVSTFSLHDTHKRNMRFVVSFIHLVCSVVFSKAFCWIPKMKDTFAYECVISFFFISLFIWLCLGSMDSLISQELACIPFNIIICCLPVIFVNK